MLKLFKKFEIIIIIKKFIIFITLFSLISCSATSYNYNKQLSKIEECKSIEPFFSKSRSCLKQSIIASDKIYPELETDILLLINLIENNLNENRLSNEMAWKLFVENLEIAMSPSTQSEVKNTSLKLNEFIKSMK
jgi:hypothetical protein|tara:strand:- start:415 stop:819 length:405 start_codon:yes stop_codon:yes gene_type:complete